MNALAAQLQTVRRLLSWINQRWDDSGTRDFSLEPDVERVPPQLDENRDLSALCVIALANIFDFPPPDSLAFSDTAFGLRKRLFRFPFEGWMP